MGMGNRPAERSPFAALFKSHGKRMLVGIGLGLVAIASAVGLLSLAGWFLTAAAIAGLSAAGSWHFNFFLPSIGVRLFAFSRTLARYGERVVNHDTTFRILESLRVWFYHHIEPLAPACLSRYRSGDILNRLVEDIDTLDNLFVRVLSPSAAAFAVSVLLFAFLWLFDPVIAVCALAFLAVAGCLVPLAAGSLGAQTGRRLSRKSAVLRVRIIEALQGMPELLVYGAQSRQLESIRRDSDGLMASQRRMSYITGFTTALITLISGLAVTCALYLGVDRIDVATGYDGADLALVTLAVMASYEAVWPLPTAFQFLGRTREAGRRIMEIVTSEPAVRYPEQSRARPERYGLTFENVSFRYAENAPFALDSLDFQVAAGSRVAVLGTTGSGKTSLVNLLVRFWEPTSGRICIDGADIRKLSAADLRRSVSVVSQQAHIFSTSLRENLLMARADATEADLREALAAAQLLSFVDNLPDGLDTWVGEAGKMLSGGQARRLAVARAFVHDAPIWVLDEPTEGLDRVTERRLMQAIMERTAGKTVVLITHRMVDIHRLDASILIDNGRLVAQGRHANLLARNPRYRRFWGYPPTEYPPAGYDEQTPAGDR
jgi:ATP-binding cassette subfamily C protein CydC